MSQVLKARYAPDKGTTSLEPGEWKWDSKRTLLIAMLPVGTIVRVPMNDGRWKVVDGRPEFITIAPSIDCGELWHGHLSAGEWRWP